MPEGQWVFLPKPYTSESLPGALARALDADPGADRGRELITGPDPCSTLGCPADRPFGS